MKHQPHHRINHRQQIPPRQLLHVVKENQGSLCPPLDSSFYWKATSSWAIASYSDYESVIMQRRQPPINVDRAKFASGVSHLIRSVDTPTNASCKTIDPATPWSTRYMWWTSYLLVRVSSIWWTVVSAWLLNKKGRVT
jgi:hypothetical protein